MWGCICGGGGGESQFGKFGKTKEPLILSQESWEKEAFLATVESGSFVIYHQTIYKNGIWGGKLVDQTVDGQKRIQN